MQNKPSILFIINPKAGNKFKGNLPGLISDYCNKLKINFEIKFTEYPQHAKQLAKEAVAKNTDIVFAAGGDGTLNEVASSLVNTSTVLGLLPFGSGNGLARCLKIPLNTLDALKLIETRHYSVIDSGLLNGLYFFNVAGCGFDAKVAHTFATLPKRGFLSYVRAVFKDYFSYPQETIKLTLNESEFYVNSFLLSFANSNQFGNNAFIAPQAKTDDGLLDVVNMRKPKWYQIPSLIFRLFNKSVDKHPLVNYHTSNKIKLNNHSGYFHIDGEPLKIKGPIEIKVLPKSLRILT